MIRTQIQLTDALSLHAKQIATREHISISELIRRAIAAFIASAPDAMTDTRYERAASVAGQFASGRPDISTHHDAHFAKASGK